MPALLRGAGWAVRTHHEVYGARDEAVQDVEWLELCGAEGFPVLSKDRRLRYRPAEIAAIRRHNVKAFVLVQGGLRAVDQVARFEANRGAIEAVCDERGPVVYSVYADRIVRIFP
ncbi:MAG: hypothetical protein ACRDQT_02485 [Gaiellaceae bacterium]